MTEPFDAVLADIRRCAVGWFAIPALANTMGKLADRLSAAHAAEVAERDARIAELDSECRQHLLRALENGQAALAAEARTETAERDAGELRGLLRECLHILDGFKPARANEHDELAARVAAIATTEQADE